MTSARDRGAARWDRAARYLKVARILHAHPEGVSAQQIADQIGLAQKFQERTLFEKTDNLDLVAQLITIEAPRRGDDNAIAAAALDFVGEPTPARLAFLKLEEMRAHRQRRARLVEQRQRHERLRRDQSLWLNFDVREEGA